MRHMQTPCTQPNSTVRNISLNILDETELKQREKMLIKTTSERQAEELSIEKIKSPFHSYQQGNSMTSMVLLLTVGPGLKMTLSFTHYTNNTQLQAAI